MDGGGLGEGDPRRWWALPVTLIGSRVLQAIAAATLVPQVLAIIRVVFAAHERPLAFGLYGTSMGFASIVAQLLGGASSS